MKKLILSAIASSMLLSGGAMAQKTAEFAATADLDVASANVGSVYAATYSIADDKFLASNAGTTIRIYNGTTGAYESDLNISGITPANLGFFALAAGTDGSIFAYEQNNDVMPAIWQWDNVADTTPALAASGAADVPFARAGQVIGTGNDTVLMLTGSANNGPIQLYETADDVTYTVLETIPGAAVSAKSTAAINSTLDDAWGMGDSNQPVTKAVKDGGVWSEDAAFTAPAGANNSAVIAYDEANDVLIAKSAGNLYILDGTTGEELATFAVTNSALSTVPGYGGGIVSSTLDVPSGNGTGTVWIAGRGTTASNAALTKISYTVTVPPPPTAADKSWSIYQ